VPEEVDRRRPRRVLLVAAVGLGVALVPTAGAPVVAQIVTTTSAPLETTTSAPPETTVPETTAPPETTVPPTTAPPATRPPTTRATTTTVAPSTTAGTVATTAPPQAPVPAPTTTAVVQEQATITQDTPDLTAVLAIWVLSILAAAGIVGATWWRSREG